MNEYKYTPMVSFYKHYSEYLCRVGDVKIVTYIPLQPAGHSSLAYLLPKPVCLAIVVRDDTEINVTL